MSIKRLLFVSVGPRDLELTGEELNVFHDELYHKNEIAKLDKEAYITYTRFKQILSDNFKNEDEPPIELIHFCGHSSEEEIEFRPDPNENHNGKVKVSEFTAYVKSYTNIKIFIFNSCDSENLANELYKFDHIKSVIFTGDRLFERDGIIFTKEFYRCLMQPLNIENAFLKVKKLFKKNVNKINDLHRGTVRSIGKNLNVGTSDFPWERKIKVDFDWSLYKDIPETKDSKTVRILHLFEKDSKPGDLTYDVHIALKSAYSISTALKQEVHTYNSLTRIKKLDALKAFDSVVIFLNDSTYSILSLIKSNDELKYIAQVDTIAVVNCAMSLNESLDAISKEYDLTIDNKLRIPNLGFFNFRNVDDKNYIKVLSDDHCSEGVKLICNKKNIVQKSILSQKLKIDYLKINFDQQHTNSAEFLDANIVILEGTEWCAHELLVRRIVNRLKNKHSKLKFLPIVFDSRKQMKFESVEALNKITNFLVGAKIDDVSFDLFKSIITQKLKQHSIIINIEIYTPKLKFIDQIRSFYNDVTKAFEGYSDESENKLFVFILNKAIDESTSLQSLELNITDEVNIFVLPTIEKITQAICQTWTDNLDDYVKNSESYKTFDHTKVVKEGGSYLRKTVEKVNQHFELDNDVIDEVFKIKERNIFL